MYSTQKKYYFGVFFIITLVLATLWGYSSKMNFVPCISNCGETFYAETEVSNFKLYGFKYGLLEDHATSNNLSAHPFLYTHNVNIAGILYPLMSLVGLDFFWAKQLPILFIFGLGLFYVYKTTQYFSKSHLIAFLMLFFFCSDYYHVFSYGLNALRAWHWLILFGLLFHAGRYFTEKSHVKVDRIMIVLFATLSFGIGYDFWIINFFIATTLFVFNLPNKEKLKTKAFDLFFILTFFLIPVILRQIHVASTLGVDFWYHDFIYSAAIKVPFLKNYISLPPMSEIDNYYLANHILRAPASQEVSWSNIFRTLRDMIQQIIKPSFGTVTIWNMALFLALPILATLYYLNHYLIQIITHHFNQPKLVAIFTSLENLQKNAFNEIKGGLKLFAILVIGISIGLAIFAPFSLHVYFKHQFPLIAAPIFLAKSIACAILIMTFIKLFKARSSSKWLVITLIIFVFIDHTVIQISNIKYFEPISTAWISAVKKYPHSSFATSWIADSVVPYTDNWVVAISQASESKIIHRLQKNKLPFRYNDYFLFSQQDVREKEYLHPDYWLYYTIEQSDQFDAPSPICYKDYLAHFFDKINPASPQVAYLQDTNNGKFAPGAYIAITGNINNPSKTNIHKIELKSNGKILKTINYNCIYGNLYVVYKTPKDYKANFFKTEIIATYNDNKKMVLGRLTFQNDPSVKISTSQINPAYFKHNQIPVNELVSLLPNIPIQELGKDYVIFDLKQYYSNAVD